jgi:secreted PhoX family phosphatase
MTLSRRDLFKRSAATGAGLLVAGNLDVLLAGAAGAVPGAGAGPLVTDPAGLLDLPAGFKYTVVSRSGDPLVGHPGTVPGGLDGMGAFADGRGVALVRNHELGGSGTFRTTAAPEYTYDPRAYGGTTTLKLTADDRLVDEYVSIAGTISNCAGGVTPWNTWLTCEETEQRRNATYTKDHGWVFEVDPFDDANNVNPTPLTGLGRFAHEAAIVDPDTGHVYLTEDAGGPNGLFYRFTPSSRPRAYGDLRGGGALEAMYVPDVLDLSPYTEIGTELPVTWKAVPDPSAATVSIRRQFSYGAITTPAGPITRSRKFEGLWWGRGRAFVVCSYARLTDGSVGQHDGQVWSLDPRTNTLRLEVAFPVATDTDTQPDGPDNITVSPYGGFFLAEDGDGVQHLLAVDEDGETSVFATNTLNDSEFAGVVFSPDGRTLFCNVQSPGITYAITGPFARFNRDTAGKH